MAEIQKIIGSFTPITVVIAGQKLTGIRTGIASRGFGAQQLASVTMHGGMLVLADRFLPWQVDRLVEHDGELYLCGPHIPDARSIGDAIDRVDAGTEDHYPLLEALFTSARHALPHDLSLANIVCSAIGSDGSVLFLKRELAERINANIPLELRQTAHFPYRHDLLQGVEAETYQLAAIAYRILTGRPICADTDVKKAALCHSAGSVKEPVHLHRPEVSPGAATMIDAILAGSGQRDTAAFTALTDEILVGSSRLMATDLPPEEAELHRQAAREQLGQWTKAHQRRSFLRQYGKRIAIISAAILLVATIPFGILKTALTPPPTVGMSPREVVELFYNAWNDLDHVLMEEIVARNVAKDLIREVTNVYVIERVQIAYGDRGRMLSVDEWNAEGRPDDRMPYGIDEFSIRSVQQSEDRARVIAEYRIWRPEGDEQTMIIHRTRVRDEIILEPEKNAWEIVEINQQIIETISDPISVQSDN